MPKSPSDPMQQFLATVKPIAPSDRKPAEKPDVVKTSPSKSRPAEVTPSNVRTLPLSDGLDEASFLDPVLSFHRPNALKGDWLKLKKGKLPVEREIDLHGLFVDQARTQVSDFMQGAFAEGLRCVRIIHGKGAHSPNGGRLKRQVNHWLPQIGFVLGFYSCLPKDGGNGAVYVLLKRARSPADD